MNKLTGNESIIEELNIIGDIWNGYAVMTKDDQGYHMRDSRNLFGKFRHDLPPDASAERVEAHWNGFVANLRAG